MRENNNNYIYAFDISLSNTGLTIFDKNGNPIKILSISTNSKQDHPARLKIIADSILELKKEFPVSKMIFESGFARYSRSTEAIFKVIGLIQYLFNEIEQFSFAPSSIRKVICGNGRADKKDVEKAVLNYWPNLVFDDSDQSDSCGLGLCYFIKEGIIDGKK